MTFHIIYCQLLKKKYIYIFRNTAFYLILFPFKFVQNMHSRYSQKSLYMPASKCKHLSIYCPFKGGSWTPVYFSRHHLKNETFKGALEILEFDCKDT